MERAAWKSTNNTSGHSRTTLWKGWLLLSVLALGGTLAANAVTFTASLDRNTITLGERATLSLKFEDASPNAPALPAIAGLQIDYVGPASQFSFINGRTTSSLTHTYVITPQQIGDFTIPALTATVGGEKLTTQPLQLKVVKPSAPPPEAIASGSELAFMRLVLPRNELYVGETTVAQLQLFFRDSVRGIGNFRITSSAPPGIAMNNKFVQGQEQTTQIGNTQYRMVPLQMTFSAVKSGTIEFGPITATLTAEIATGNRPRDPWRERLGWPDPFSRHEQKELTLVTESQTMQLLPVPDKNRPATFNGAIGNYTMTMTVAPTNIAVGDPITMRVQISGRGSLDALTLPEQPQFDKFKVYPPNVKGTQGADEFALQGTKEFEQVVVPQSMDIQELPPFYFSFFDPETKEFCTLTQPAVPLTVRPAGAPQLPSFAAASDAESEQPDAQDLVPIKQRIGPLAQISQPIATQPWFLGAQSVPVLAWLAALVWRKRTDSLANNPRLRRQRHVSQVIREGTRELQRLAAEKNSDEFFATLFRLLQEQLGERLDCPASSITEAVIDERLRPLRVDEATVASLHDLFQMCNLARYAPVKSSEELSAIVPKFEAVVGKLREVKV